LILPSQFYEENLYPLQDGVLNVLNQCGTNFFLTGGTALSRAYFNHRYSDDLDFFLNQSQHYDDELNLVLHHLKEAGFFWSESSDFVRNISFTTLKIGKPEFDVLLKLYFVNDSVPLFGEIQKTELFYRTDSIRNILSNKLSAIYRYAAKDVADIREIALREKVDWKQAINEGRQKEGGLEPVYIIDILQGMPESEFETITWTKKPSWEEFKSDIVMITKEITSGESMKRKANWDNIFSYGQSLAETHSITEDDVNEEIRKYRDNQKT